MNSDLYFDGKQYISSSRAAKISGYVNDYIGQLCRDGKLECRMVGRSWYVSFESLISHKNSNGGNAKSRIKKIPSQNSQVVTFKQNVEIESTQDREPFRAIPVNTLRSEFLKRTEEVPCLTQDVVKKNIEVSTEAVLVSPYASQADTSHHADFEKRFPKIVAGMVAFLFAISIFQFSLNLNKDVELAYQSAGDFIEESFLELIPSENVFSANVAAGATSGLDRFAISFYKTVHGILFDTRETIIVLFGGEVPEQEKSSPHLAQAPQGVTDGQGMVVVPVEVKTDQDAVIAKIKDSFSDEVNVLPKDDGVSGVITPVFRKAANEDYLYVLVPIKN